jgi:hypothetical protein
MKKTTLFVLSCCATIYFSFAFSQEETALDSTELFEEEEYYEEDGDMRGETFNSTRVINGHSVETLSKKVLEFRVEHRLGDMAGDLGGVQTMFGLDNAADIRLGFEYGITDDLMIGLGRSKGTGVPYKSLIDGFVKYRILTQQEGSMPISMTAVGSAFISYMKASENIASVANFPEFQHRMAYSAQLNIAKKFGERVSLMIAPTMVHRNYVDISDENTMFALGAAIRVGITERLGFITEYYYVFEDDDELTRPDNENGLGVAFEWSTFGHNFKIHLTNSRGFGDVQYITGTYSDWLKGQFRIGFCIGRKFMWE